MASTGNTDASDEEVLAYFRAGATLAEIVTQIDQLDAIEAVIDEKIRQQLMAYKDKDHYYDEGEFEKS